MKPVLARLVRTNPRFVLHALAAALLVLWWHAKRVLFEGFAYYSDLFSFIQMSKTWLEGRPFLYENAFGRTGAYHTFFTVSALGPLTHFLGAYGLFVATLGLLAAGFVAALRTVTPARRPSWATGLLLLALMLGPVSFWIWDDYAYGWHAEILFLPLGVLYAAALIANSRWRWPLLAAVCLTREEGPLLAFAIDFLRRALRGISAQPQDHGFGRLALTYLRTAPPYLLAFGALLATIVLQGGGGAARFSSVLHKAGSASFDGRAFLYWTFLLSPLLLVIVAAHRAQPVLALRALAGLGLALLPLFAVTWLASLDYRDGPRDFHGLMWPPRFVMSWTAGMAAVLTCLPRLETALAPAGRAVLVTLVVAVQPWALAVTRHYSLAARLWPALPVRPSVTADDARFLRCLSDHMEPGTPIAPSWYLYAAFHEHDIVWPDRLQNAWRPPVLIVCEAHGKNVSSNACLRLREQPVAHGFAWVSQGGILVGYSPGFGTVISPCLATGSRLRPPQPSTTASLSDRR